MADLTKKQFDLPTRRDKLAVPDEQLGQRMGGLTLFPNSFRRGKGAKVYGSDSSGIWLGAADFSDAPFSVSMAGSVVANDITLTGGTVKFGKTSFSDTTNAGYHISEDGFYFGSASDTSFIKYNISTGALDIKGDITGGSLNINDNAVIDSSGFGTFVGVATLNKKAFTNFETAARYITSSGDSGAVVFGNQGVTLSTGTTISGNGGYSRLLWDIANVFSNRPMFTATMKMFTVGSGDAHGFVGLGLPTVSGSGIVYSSKNQIGFKIDKTSGVVTLSSEMNNGGSGTSVGASITTLVQGDIVELFVTSTGTEVKWYYRKNGGALTLGDTQTTVIPTGSGAYVSAMLSNAGSANDYKIVLQSASYEH